MHVATFIFFPATKTILLIPRLIVAFLSDFGWNSLDFAIAFVVFGHPRLKKLNPPPREHWTEPPCGMFLSGAWGRQVVKLSSVIVNTDLYLLQSSGLLHTQKVAVTAAKPFQS